jgi:hypothetical protein
MVPCHCCVPPRMPKVLPGHGIAHHDLDLVGERSGTMMHTGAVLRSADGPARSDVQDTNAGRHCPHHYLWLSRVRSLSSHHPRDLFAERTYREALSSICKLAFVEIVTKGSDSAQTFTKVVQGGQVLMKGASDVHRALGTTVTVRDFFFNVPVRRKQLSAGHELEKIKQTLERIALVHPQVRFSLYDSTKGTRILQTRQVLYPVAIQ